MMDIGMLIVFTLPPGTSSTMHKKLAKKLFGEMTSSWGGKYCYRRKGFLDEIPYVKLYTGVIIVRCEDVSKIIDFLDEFDATIHKRKVILNPSDKGVLLTPF